MKKEIVVVDSRIKSFTAFEDDKTLKEVNITFFDQVDAALNYLKTCLYLPGVVIFNPKDISFMDMWDKFFLEKRLNQIRIIWSEVFIDVIRNLETI